MAPNFGQKWANIGPFTPNIVHIRQNPVDTNPTTTRKKGPFSLKTGDFLWEGTRFSCPQLVTGFRGSRNPDTRYGHIGHF